VIALILSIAFLAVALALLFFEWPA